MTKTKEQKEIKELIIFWSLMILIVLGDGMVSIFFGTLLFLLIIKEYQDFKK